MAARRPLSKSKPWQANTGRARRSTDRWRRYAYYFTLGLIVTWAGKSLFLDWRESDSPETMAYLRGLLHDGQRDEDWKAAPWIIASATLCGTAALLCMTSSPS